MNIPQRLEEMIRWHKEKACVIADSAEYDPTNMTRYIENPIIRSLVFQHIDSVRELSEISSHFSTLINEIVDEILPEEIEDGLSIESGVDITDLPPEMFAEMNEVKKGYLACLSTIKANLERLQAKEK